VVSGDEGKGKRWGKLEGVGLSNPQEETAESAGLGASSSEIESKRGLAGK